MHYENVVGYDDHIKHQCLRSIYLGQIAIMLAKLPLHLQVEISSLAMTLTSLIMAMTSPANAQLSNTQWRALSSLVKTGYTNSYPINPPLAWCTGCQIFSILQSIHLGQLLAMVPDQPRTSLDILLAPTKYQTSYRLFTIRIP
jgi:hypothetical protein